MCEGNFWGRTLAAVSSSTDPSCRDRFGPYLPGARGGGAGKRANLASLRRSTRLRAAGIARRLLTFFPRRTAKNNHI